MDRWLCGCKKNEGPRPSQVLEYGDTNRDTRNTAACRSTSPSLLGVEGTFMLHRPFRRPTSITLGSNNINKIRYIWRNSYIFDNNTECRVFVHHIWFLSIHTEYMPIFFFLKHDFTCISLRRSNTHYTNATRARCPNSRVYRRTHPSLEKKKSIC
jgi:hypothetical protein